MDDNASAPKKETAKAGVKAVIDAIRALDRSGRTEAGRENKETVSAPDAESTTNTGTAEDQQAVVRGLDATCFSNWSSILSFLGDPANHFFTKEDAEVVQSHLQALGFSSERNIADYLCQNSTDPCNIEKLIKFLVVRKIGTPLLTQKKNRLDTLLRTHDNTRDIIISFVGAIERVTIAFSIDPIVDAKQGLVVVALQAQLVALLLKLDGLDTIIQADSRTDEFCLTACTPECGDPACLALCPPPEIPSPMEAMVNDVADSMDVMKKMIRNEALKSLQA